MIVVENANPVLSDTPIEMLLISDEGLPEGIVYLKKLYSYYHLIGLNNLLMYVFER